MLTTGKIFPPDIYLANKTRPTTFKTEIVVKSTRYALCRGAPWRARPINFFDFAVACFLL